MLNSCIKIHWKLCAYLLRSHDRVPVFWNLKRALPNANWKIHDCPSRLCRIRPTKLPFEAVLRDRRPRKCTRQTFLVRK